MASRVVAVPDDPVQCQDFLSWIQMGYGPKSAGEAVGWTHLQIIAVLDDDEFGELIKWSQDLLYEGIEQVLIEKAQHGNQRALEMVLYNKRPDQWRPPTQRVKIDRHDTIDQRIVVSLRDQVAVLLEKYGPAALQPGGILDAIETTATDGPDQG